MEKHAGKIRQIAISSIRVAERIRKENGSLDELAQDIQKHGLLNPITVMEQADGGYVLIAGLRRMKAMEHLGDTQIRATVMSPMEADEMLMLEIAENEQRKEFTVSNPILKTSAHFITAWQASSRNLHSRWNTLHSNMT